MPIWGALAAIASLASLISSIKQNQKAMKLQDRQRRMSELQAAAEKVGTMSQERDRSNDRDFSQMLEAMVAAGMRGEDTVGLTSGDTQPLQNNAMAFGQPTTTSRPFALGQQQNFSQIGNENQTLTPEMIELIRKYYGGLL